MSIDYRTYFPEADVSQWADRFNRQPAHFHPGEQVAVDCRVHRNSEGELWLVTADRSHGTDVFQPNGLNPALAKQLEANVGSIVVAKVTIHQRLANYSCENGSKYAITPDLEVIPAPLNPTANELQALPVDSRVLIEGTATDYWEEEVEEPTYPGSWRTRTVTVGQLQVRTDDGRLIAVPSSRPQMKPLAYGGGVLENLSDKPIIPGERLRLVVYVQEGRYGRRQLHAVYSQPYLMTPDHARQVAYNRLRGRVAPQVRKLESYVVQRQYARARTLFAHLRTLELTKHEHQRVRGAMDRAPVLERSIYDNGRYDVERLERAFGVDIERLNKAEFMRFAREIVLGIRPNAPKPHRVDQSYVFHYMRKAPFTTDELVALCREGLQERVRRLGDCTDDHDSHWDDSYLADQCLNYLGHTDHPAAAEPLVWMVNYCLEHDYVPVRRDSGQPSCPTRYRDLLDHALRSLGDLISSHPHLARTIGAPEQVETWQAELTRRQATVFYADKLEQVRVAIAAAG
jgi:hypothetical protein